MPRTNVFSKRRKFNVGVFGRRKRRRRRVSRRLKRAIKRIAFSDTEVRWIDKAIADTPIQDISTIADNATDTVRIGASATTGFLCKPIHDAGEIAIGTGFNNRTSHTIYALGIKAVINIHPKYHVSNANKSYFVRMVWGYHHPDALAYDLMDPGTIYPNLGAPGGVPINAALFPWNTNKAVATFEERDKYHVEGEKVFRVQCGATGTLATETNARETIFKWHWPMNRKIEFANSFNYPVGKMIPYIFMFADKYNDANAHAAVKMNLRFYWKNID